LKKKNEGQLTIIETEILSDVIRFYGNQIKPDKILSQFNLVQEILLNKKVGQYDVYILLLSSYTKHLNENEKIKIIQEIKLNDDFYKIFFTIVCTFNGDLIIFNSFKNQAIKILVEQPKDQAIGCLKMIGKIMNKYQHFIEFDKENFSNLLEEYEIIVNNIIQSTQIFKPSNSMLDANLLVFILSLGYMNIYSKNNYQSLKLLMKFLLELMNQSKINSKLLVDSLSLLVLKTVKQNVGKDEIIEAINQLNLLGDEEVTMVENFFKKIYYLYN